MQIADSVERLAYRKERMKTNSFKDLVVWQKSYKLVLEFYEITNNFPKHEMYSLVQQIRRAAVSIPSNIAEGYGRQYNKEYKQFLSVAYGSLCELETQYMIAVELGYSGKENLLEELMKEVGAMLYRMINPK
ncbi:MAG: four helix bundle protein [Pseudomonadota bacterium]